MIPRLRPTLGRKELLASLRSRPVEAFEQRFAELTKQKHALAFPYGRTGLLLLLNALGLRDVDIICPAYTCVVVAHAILLSGNRPLFVDSEASGFNMDLNAAAAHIEAGAAVIIATSIHGYPVDLDHLEKLQEANPGLIVIQDCAHSFTASWRGRTVQNAGIAAIFGLNVSKLMTSIFGGMVTTDDDALAGRLRALRDASLQPASFPRAWARRAYLLAAGAALSPPLFGIVSRLKTLGLIDRYTEYYDETRVDMPSDYLQAMTKVESAVGIAQCERYASIVARHRALAEIYDEELADLPGLVRPPLVDGATYSHYVPRHAAPDELAKRMAKSGVEIGRVIDYNMPDMPAYRRYVPSTASFPRARQLNKEVINLPLHVNVAEARRIAALLRRHVNL